MTGKVRKPYKKPGIKKVRLIPEEAVLTTCKVNTSDSGPGTTCGGGGACKVAGALS